MPRAWKILLPLLLLAFVAGALAGISAWPPNGTTHRIGVLLPLSGPDSLESQEVLDWMLSGLNSSGGIGGTPVELVYKDTYGQDSIAVAREFTSDPTIRVVIGPQKSSEMHMVAPLFIESKKLLISPMATAGDIMRAYGKRDFIWRTCQSDIAQVRSILFELATRDVSRISLVYSDDSYGRTFLEWTGFFCTELGIDLLDAIGLDGSSDLEDVLEGALDGAPEYVLAAVYSVEAVALKGLLDERDTGTRLFLTDAAATPYLIETLGPAAEGIELISPAADPGSDFEEAYYSEYGYYPWDYAAATGDAFLLAVYALARQESRNGIRFVCQREPLEESFKRVISGTGVTLGWDEYAEAVDLILKGDLPDIEGASGPLRFDREFGVDPTVSFYSLNRVETIDGMMDFVTVRRFSSIESQGVGLLDDDMSVASTRASLAHVDLRKTLVDFQPGERDNLKAVIMSTSAGWDDYRHQADALAVYGMLRANGVADEDIILFSVDDVPWLADNLREGDVRHEVEGANLREGATIDYSGDAVTLDTFRNVLLGHRSPATPVVLDSNERTNVLVYIAGHGMPRALNFHNRDQLAAGSLAEIIDEMSSADRFRQMLVIVEACYGESLAMDIDTPGVLYLTGASRMESSFGTNYDIGIRQWLADEFTVQLIGAMKEPHITLEDLYLTVYRRVAGSHVRLVNHADFGDLRTPVSEFVNP